MKRTGFTLMELMVVIVIIAALAGIGFPVTRSILAKSKEAACLGNLRSIGIGLQGYLQDNQQRLPDLEAGRASKTEDLPVIETVLLEYVGTEETFHCPADAKEFKKTGSSYLWNSTQSGQRVTDLSFFGIKDRPDKIPLITDKEAWHPNGTNFLYADSSSSNKVKFNTGH